jgi:single-strand selective monofunctional uracil DNA glycosylase
LWGWAQKRFGDADAFFEHYFVWNYCPLAFLKDSGANLTPDKLPAPEREPLHALCDAALRKLVDLLEPSHVLGIGKFAEKQAQKVLGEGVPIGTVLHPSPASPLANKGWAPQAEKQLKALGCARW